MTGGFTCEGRGSPITSRRLFDQHSVYAHWVGLRGVRGQLNLSHQDVSRSSLRTESGCPSHPPFLGRRYHSRWRRTTQQTSVKSWNTWRLPTLLQFKVTCGTQRLGMRCSSAIQWSKTIPRGRCCCPCPRNSTGPTKSQEFSANESYPRVIMTRLAS